MGSVTPAYMNRRAVLAGLAAVPTLGLAGCMNNPHLGRDQLMMVGDAEMRALGSEAWRDMHSLYPRGNPVHRRELERIGSRVVTASGQTHENWEFQLFEGPANAFALPGGKVGFFTGIFNHLSNDAQTAAIMGHEAGHVVARHGAERISQVMLASIAMAAVSAVLARQASSRNEVALVAALLGAGVTYGILLPYSRAHEYEADRLGLRYMAEAGYDPQEAGRMWQRMSIRAAQGRGPEFLSTHPSDESRLAEIQAQTPGLMPVYLQARKT